MNNITIHRAFQEDIDSISQLVNKAYLPGYKEQNLSAKTIYELLTSNSPKHINERFHGNYFFVAKDNDNIIGVIRLRKDNERPLHDRVSTFCVDKSYRGKGVGSLLFQEVLKLAIKFNVKILVVKASLFAEPIYAHWGFKKIKTISQTFPDGHVHRTVWMEKKL
jgi:predicted GNAT family N-acyltransferase